MSDKPRFQRSAALAVAKEWCDLFRPATLPDRLMVCGSLRRRKSEVGDVEIVYVPRIHAEQNPNDLFSQITVSEPDTLLETALRQGKLTKRLAVTGRVSSWGAENKHAVHVASGIPIDFFATTESDWWVTVVIRTGSKDMNLRLTTGAQKLGRKLNAYGSGFTDLATGGKIVCHSEQDVFKYAGVDYLEPWQR